MAQQSMRARNYYAHPNIRDHCALRCMNRCPDLVVCLKRDLQCLRHQLDSVAIGVSSRPNLTGIVRGKAFLHVLRRRPIGCPDSRKRTYNARCDGYDREQHRLDYFSNDICTLRNEF
ncbi:hypothetical protein TNCV_3539131 [Trichonephila clavipes]|nr:hypothetical protein TNCV_3539131 [Trichonephila clavipes]